ncbi:16S rRNA (cytidine(1402)-2'-O)-methyltransferase [Haematospirillum jordaniae]|uniref:16S rRNA (cytidine(1402)-2'-O)-methyltransferase n=1 Tax=Haematospirillum jordaniae TaxID=1549855 RepID=UPI002AC33142|nr:16S rRNA (cytidine(1402)-2'-O)-methyltransferase [Haematospirillum jordaniae]
MKPDSPGKKKGARLTSGATGKREGHASGHDAVSKPVPERTLSAGLYIVATPIGNMGDITERACRVLAGADVVACEDTRVTGAMLKRLGMSVPLLAYHEHNADRVRPQILARVAGGEAVVLVSDAGTPLISDPGYKLVRSAADEGLSVIPVPGASALLTALMVAGLPTDRFLFAGFPPARSKARQDLFASLAAVPATLVFYESVHRLPESLADMAAVLGDRPAAVCRELTKLYEDVRRGSLPELSALYEQEGAPRGEVVVVVGPPSDTGHAVSTDDIDALLRQSLQTLSIRDAVSLVAGQTGVKKRDVYARALELTTPGHMRGD